PGHGSAGEETAGPRALLIVSHGPSSSPRLLIVSFHHAPSPRRRPRPDRSRNESVTLPASADSPVRRRNMIIQVDRVSASGPHPVHDNVPTPPAARLRAPRRDPDVLIFLLRPCLDACFGAPVLSRSPRARL